jgi:multicomponent Na+:H+ antiporter subunit F
MISHLLALTTALTNAPAQLAAEAGLIALSVAIVLCFFRVVVGPTLPDRVVALDLIATLLVGLLLLHGIASGESGAMGVALVLALVNFLATVAFAAHVQRRVQR